MNVVEFKFNKFIEKDPFRINDDIEPIYIEIAEMVLNRLYKAYCFNPLFEGIGTIEEQAESLKSAVITWADCFMDWKIDDIERAKDAANNLIFINLYPTVGLFRACYFNENMLIEKNIYEEYINYLYKFCFHGKDGKIHGADYFSTWDKERANANKDIE
jgi:hypothetical protein